MTEMDLMRIREELRRLTVLAEGWSAAGITALERDLALGKLRELYDIVCFTPCGETSPAEIPAEEVVPVNISLDEVLLAVAPVSEELPEAEPVSVSEPESAIPVPEAEPVVPEPTAVLSEKEAEPVVAEASVSTPEPETEPALPESTPPVSEPEISVSAPEPAPAKPLEQALFGLEEIEQHKRKQRVIMSLYDDAPAVSHPASTAPAPKPGTESETKPTGMQIPQVDPDVTKSPVPAPEFEPAGETEPDPIPETGPDSEIIYAGAAPETTAVLGEVINRGVQTLGETLSTPRNTISEAAHMAHVDDLRAAIGINDRFLLVRDLFGGDAAACDAAIDKLNSFDDLDDCMVYIAEHYAWNPNSDGAKLLVELLERKLI